MNDDLIIPTRYGPASLTLVETWQVLTCPVCHREHAHPPGVTADYWPMCWDCWEARPACFRRQKEE